MGEHTPEPWVQEWSEYDGDGSLIVAPSSAYTAQTVAKGMGPRAISNARRIIACVNACAGMDDPAAEIARLRADNDELDEVCTRRQLEIYELDAEIAKLRAEREELRQALKSALLYVSNYASEFDEIIQARAALAEKGE